MKKNYIPFLVCLSFVFSRPSLSAQCASTQTLGTASNMFTKIRNSTSSIAANKALNTVVFIHRNDAALFGGNSGNLRYDVSTNGGTTWNTNLGVLNPLNSNLARYPNIAIYNPVANTNTANVYVSYMAPTINSVNSTWNGEVTGVQQLTGTGTTESYNQNGIGTTWQASSLVNGAPGVFWATDAVVPAGLTGFNIYKGVWNSATSDIVWNINTVITPSFNTGWTSSPTITDYNIAFDPTGQIGYFSFLGHVTPGPAPYGLYPVFYKTTNGGNTWTGPIQVDLTKFSCITSNTTSPNVPSTNIEHDLVVDVNGNPHLITTVGSAANYNFVYSAWHRMYDITLKNGVWAAYDLGNVNGSPNVFGVSPNIATQWQAPQAARSADGTKIFFTWTDNTNYTLGAQNSSPNLFGKAYDVVNNTWTATKDFTSCNLATAGQILFPHIAPEVLEPNSTTYKVAAVYGQNAVSGDLLQTANFIFLENITFLSSEFTVTVPPATVNIQQGPLVIACANSSVTLNLSGNAGEALWSNGINSTSISITSGTVTSYSVVAQVGCNVGTASVAVNNLTANPASLNSNICPGNPANFSVSGNALSYTWSPGSVTGTNVTLFPTSNTVSLTALGSGSCTDTYTLGIVLLPAPNISISGNDTICAGYVMTQNASGAQSYSWSTGAIGATFTDTPLVNTSYTVIGTAANSCTNTQTVSIFVKPSPTISASSSPTAICVGQSAAIIASGALSYSVDGNATGNTATVTPNSTSIYTVSGLGSNLCVTNKTLEITVYALPSLTVSQNRNTFCKGENIRLTASGASSYTWVVPGLLTPSIQVNPTVTTNYTVIGTSAEGCVNSKTFALVVSPCTGIEDANGVSDGLHVYPNPNAGEFVIRGLSNQKIEIVNQLGQVVSVIVLEEDNNYSVNLSGLSEGVYFMRRADGNGYLKQKIIVVH